LTANDPDKYPAFVATYQETYGEDPLAVFHAHAYDAANIIMDAVEEVGVIDADGNLHIPRKALRDAIYGTSNFPGITGNLTCSADGDCADPVINVAQLQNGEYVPVWSAKEGMLGEAKEPPIVEEFECTDALGCVTVNAGEKLRIATALVISGPNETLGIDSQRGVEIAIDDRGEVLGFPIELVAEDGQCSAEGGQTAATKITSDETIVAVVGHNCSSSCTPAAPIYDQAGFTMISPSCTAPALTGPETHIPAFLRSCHNDKVQGAAAARFFYNELGIRTAATIHDGSPYAEQLQQVFADTFRELGGEITAQEAVNVGDTDMRPLLTSIAVDEPEMLYYPIFIAEGGFITTQAREIAGLENAILSGADGMISPDFVEAAGDAGEDMYITGPNLDFSDNPLGVSFLEKHQAKYGEDPLSAFHAHAYDAANIIFDAIEEVGVMDVDGNLHIGREALRSAVYTTTGLQGITGTLSCDEFGDCADPSITVHQIRGGAYVGVWNDESGWLEGEIVEGEDLLDQVMAAGKLLVSTDPNYAPQSFLDDNGELDGFDINVAQEVAERMGVELEFTTPDWSLITAGNWGGRWDLSIGSMTITEDRQEVLWFTQPYYYTPASFAVHNDNTDIETPDDFSGKAVGLGEATTYEAYLNGTLRIVGETPAYEEPSDVDVRSYTTDAEAVEDLALGDGVRLDGAMTSQLVIQEAINSGLPLKFVGTPAFYEPLAFALDKSRGPSDKMLAKLNEILDEMHADGTLTELSEKWYGIDITKKTEP
jgi:branched-chain amino acid transport system substrate-binding protein